MGCDYSRHNHYECTSRTTDLKARTSQSRNKKASDDRRVNTRLRGDPGGDPKRHCEWERHQPHRQTSNQIREEISPGIAGAQAQDQLGKPFSHQHYFISVGLKRGMLDRSALEL